MMFKLTKIKQIEPSMISKGEWITGELIMLWYDEKMNVHRDPYETLVIQKGASVLVIRGLNDFIRTSEVQEILEKTDTKITFRTETSIYTLEELEEK